MANEPKDENKETKSVFSEKLSLWASKAKEAVSETMNSETMKDIVSATTKAAGKAKVAATKMAKDAKDVAEKSTKSFMGKKDDEKPDDKKNKP